MSEPKDPLRPGGSTIEVQLAILFYFVPAMISIAGAAGGWIGTEWVPFLGVVFTFLAAGHGTVIVSRTTLKRDAIKKGPTL